MHQVSEPIRQEATVDHAGWARCFHQFRHSICEFRCIGSQPFVVSRHSYGPLVSWDEQKHSRVFTEQAVVLFFFDVHSVVMFVNFVAEVHYMSDVEVLSCCVVWPEVVGYDPSIKAVVSVLVHAYDGDRATGERKEV